jgi:HEAT repeat protein
VTVAPIHIRSPAQLFSALTAGEPALRYAAMKAVSEDPRAALAYGKQDGRDVVDVLLELEADSQTAVERGLVLSALAAFDDERILAPCRAVFSRRGAGPVLRLAALCLARQPAEEAHRFFAPWLMQEGWEAQAQLAAEFLADSPLLTARERIRIAAVAPDRGGDAPPLDESSLEYWLLELNGAFAGGARIRLRAQGRASLLGLLPHWHRLHSDSAEWLLEWGVADAPREVVPHLSDALGHHDEAVALAALRLLPRLGAAAAALRPRAERFASHRDADVRLAAAVAGIARQSWAHLAVEAADPRMRAAAVRWVAREGGDRAAPVLLRALADEDWSVRAAATDMLKGLGPEVVPLLEPLVRHPRIEVRAAAVQVLLAHGRYDWLEEQLLAC